MQWIMSCREDLTWIIGSAVSSFIMLALYLLLVVTLKLPFILGAGVLYAIFLIFFDGTHIFATYTRTYFNKPFFKENKPLLICSIGLIFAGPLFVLGAFALDGIESARGAFIILNRFGFTFAYFHVIRQHWGFMSIYRRKNDVNNGKLNRYLDGCVLGFGLMTPFIYALQSFKSLHTAELSSMLTINWAVLSQYLLGLVMVSVILKVICLLFRLPPNLNLFFNGLLIIFSTVTIFLNMALHIGLSSLLQLALRISSAGAAISLCAYIGYALWRYRMTKSINFPKHLFAFTVLFTHASIFLIDLHPVIYVICITIFHDIQYHKIVRHTNIVQFKETDPTRNGFVVTITEKIVVFIALALFWNLFSTIPRTASHLFIATPLINYVASAFFWGYPFHHYFLDSIIWKIRKDPALQQSLKLNQTITARSAPS
jgi:hypothetical protein